MRRQTSARIRRGTALLELIMALPVIGLVIAGIFFFGKAMTNQQHVTAAGRYHVWRHFYGWRAFQDDSGAVLQPPQQINVLFLDDKAESVGLGGLYGLMPESIGEAVNAADQYGQDVGDLADDSVADRWPHAIGGHVSAVFPNDQRIWEELTGGIRSRHEREGVVWRRGQASYLQTLRNQFFQPLDDAVEGFSDPQVRDNLKALYLRHW